MSDLECKGLVFEIKDESKGEVEAVIATLGVVDKDGDIIQPDAIKSGSKVVMSSYGHDAMFGAMPVGKGSVSVEGNRAVFKGNLFLNTTRGQETFAVLKELGASQQWSFGFRVIGSEVPDESASKQGARRILTKLDAFEVSPVIIGAGVGTRTLAMKQADGDSGLSTAIVDLVAKHILADQRALEATRAREAALTEAAKAETDRLLAEQKAKEEADRKEAERIVAELKALNELAAAEFDRFQRTKKRLSA